jgi:hypothetical protein
LKFAQRIQKPLEQSSGFFVEASAVREGKIGINAEARKHCVNAWG